MQFLSNVEKEYKDLFGDGADENKQENAEESKMESDFNNMFNDIKKDLKNVPKEDLLPGISSIPERSDSEEDEELDDEDEKKALKIGETKKKSEKKCKVGGKTYEVGERWKDPKTGKDMICILMNIPKDVLPKLAEADVIITRDEVTPESEEQDLKPTTTGSQWAYTNKQPKTRGCSSDKESERPDQVGSEAEKDDKTHQGEQAEDFGNEVKPLGELSPLDKETENANTDDTREEQTGEEATEPSEKESDSRENVEKESDDISEETTLGNEAGSARLEENDSNEGDDEETESDTDSEEEKRQTMKDSQTDDESEYEEREEDKIKYKTDSKNLEINVTKEDRETSVVQAEEPGKSAESTEKRPKGKAESGKEEDTLKEVKENLEDHPLETDSLAEVPATQEKGKTIYTKETTVTQKKLFKTSETVESVETEKKVD